MESDSKDIPPSYESVAEGSFGDVLEPATLLFAGQSIMCETTAGTAPIYQVSWDVTAIPPRGTSAVFERVEHQPPEKAESKAPPEKQNVHLFYLAHPAGAQYRKDAPAYYITSASRATLGNISLETSKARFQKTEFKALLHAGSSASSDPLFAEKPRPLFDVRPKWLGGRFTWSDSYGREVAYEEEKGDQRRLVVTASMGRDMRDAMVATWCLRLWHDTAESRAAKKDGELDCLPRDKLPETSLSCQINCLPAMERLTPPESVKGIGDMKLAKRVGVLAALGGA